MLRSIRSILIALVLLVLAPMVLRAQTSPQVVDIEASVTVTPYLLCTLVTDLALGGHFATEGVVSSSATNFAQVDCDTDKNAAIDVSFAFPTQLDDPVDSGWVAIVYGATAARIFDATTDQRFSVGSGITGFPVNATGSGFSITLGEGTGTDAVSVDLTGLPAATYSGIITVTVAVQ